eukprot:scaffold285906_cov36-Tisochrysis_lutea.AAC.3
MSHTGAVPPPAQYSAASPLMGISRRTYRPLAPTHTDERNHARLSRVDDKGTAKPRRKFVEATTKDHTSPDLHTSPSTQRPPKTDSKSI